ncbi:hypothetical protein NDA13_000951 [Ustilago tritici]|nr:hypothetical protein NDA13_000951 [Ustilago tritici]
MTPPPPFDPRSLYSSTNAFSSTSTSNTTSTGTPSRPNLASASPAPSGPSSKRELSGGAGDDAESFPCTAGAGGKKKPSKRRKVNLACIYCRRSHMTCDEGRPCQRCIKRDIGHLCHDEATPAKVHGGGDGEMGSSGTPSKAKVQSKAGTGVGSGSATPPPPAATGANASASNFFPTLGLGSTDAGAAGGSNSGNGNNGGSAFNGSSNGPYSSASPMSSLNQNNYAEFGAANMFKQQPQPQPQPQPPTTSTAPAQGGASMQPSTSNNNAGMLSLASLFNMTNPTPSTTTTTTNNNNNTTTAQGGSVGNGNISQPTQPTTSAPSGDISDLGGAGWLGLGGGYEGGGSGFGGDSAGGNEFTLLSEFLESLDRPGFVAGATPGMTGAAAQTSSGLTPSQSRRNTISGLASTSGGMMEGLTALTPINANANNDRSNSLSALTSSNNTGNIYDPNSGSGYNGFNTTTQQPTQNNERNGKRSRRSSFSASTSANTTTTTTAAQGNSSIASGSYLPSLQGGSSKTERFFLTAADQKDGTRDERLARVIQAKYEAGLLRPYNHVNGYARLNRWMERNVSAASKRRILKPLCVFRPAFRAVAQSLTNIDLVFIEEAFERLLLDYDRVFSTQGIPACLWRRTGEIYKGNKEFAELVGVPIEGLREGRLCIYELMAEESAVNYWEKYGAVSFDPGQKAVLTSCVLRTKNKAIVAGGVGSGGTAQSAKSIAAQLARSGSASGQQTPITEGRVGGGIGMKEDEKVAAETGATSTSGVLKDPNNPKAAFIHCCFSFTIRRDQWNIPHMIVGNFLPTNPS